ncbi:25315_t:CDS:1, partial [Gigaspora rosea]
MAYTQALAKKKRERARRKKPTTPRTDPTPYPIHQTNFYTWE